MQKRIMHMPGLLRLSHLFLPLSLCLMPSCGKRGSNSDTRYAHFPSENLTGSPIGRLEALLQGYETDFSKLIICIRTNNKKSEIDDNQLVLESKLAYAMWLEAGGYGDYQWDNYFEFRAASNCEDEGYAGVIKLGDYERTVRTESLREVFGEPPVISCSRTGYQSRCSMEGSGIVLGLGSTGYLSYSYTISDGKWTALNSGMAARSLMSPNVNWTSLKDDVLVNKELQQEVKDEIVARYDELLAQQDPAFFSLVDFGKLMAEKNIIGSGDQEFSMHFDDFVRSDSASMRKSYTPKRGLFHVLLHEIGHQYGMAHADNPSSADVTGETEGFTKVREDGKWITDISTMAYALSYFYLTLDDRVGITKAGDAIEGLLRDKKK